jgi:hypothetical protein
MDECGISADHGIHSDQVQSKTADDLHLFIQETDCWIGEIMQSLNWTTEHVLKKEERIACPNNRGHTVLPGKLDDHLSYCSLLNRSYTKKEILSDQSSKFFYEKSPSVVSVELDDATIRSILASAGGTVPNELPATMSLALDTYSAAQKLRIYEYCVEIARSSNAAQPIADEEFAFLKDTKADKPLSKLELLAKMRDMKRRRQSYRGKNTHTGKKNHTEVIRDVLNNQMELLANIWAEEAQEKEEKRKQEDAARRAASRHDRSSTRHRAKSKSRSRSRSSSSIRRRHHKDSRDGKSQRHHDEADKQHRRVETESSEQRKRSHGRSHSRSHQHRHKRHRRQSCDGSSSINDDDVSVIPVGFGHQEVSDVDDSHSVQDTSNITFVTNNSKMVKSTVTRTVMNVKSEVA